MPEHQGKMLRQYILQREINVEQDVLPKIADSLSKATFYKLYKEERIKPDYVNALLKAGIDFLGQSPATRIKNTLQFPQKESNVLTERVRVLEAQVSELQRSLLDLYSRLPKAN